VSRPSSRWSGRPSPWFVALPRRSEKVATEDGGVLSWAVPDIDKVDMVDMVNEILNDDARQTYIASNQELLEEQTKTFYDSLITSIDPAVTTTFEFSS
jgi:hypothetical protein